MIETIIAPVAKELWRGIFLKATLIMAIAGVLTIRFRRSSAAVRCAVWGTAFFMLIILPAASYLVHSSIVFEIEGPAQTVRASARGSAAVENVDVRRDESMNDAVAPSKGGGRGSGLAKAADGDEVGSPYVGQAAGGTGVSMERINGALRRSESANYAKALYVGAFSIWLIMAAFLIARFVVQLGRVDGITRRAVPVERSALGRDIARLIVSLDIRRSVRVMLSEETAMPFAWGAVHPKIVLPIDAGEWPADRLRSVMTHELAHVARWDYLAHIVVETARALYWPNPIVWFAARASVMERERACDDFALMSGTRSADYAAHLLDIARAQIESGIPVPAVTMAGEPRLKDRIGHVMNGAMNRGPLRRGVVALAAAAILVVMLPLSSVALRSTLWKIPHTRDLIAQLGEGGSSGERSMAAWWLGEHETERAVGPLLEALEDDSRSVRLASAWALGEIKDRHSVPELIDKLRSERDPLVREMLVLALGEIEDPSAVDALEEAYESDENLALAVVWALGEIAQRGDRDAGRLRGKIIDRIGERPWDNDEVWTGNVDRRLPGTKDAKRLIGNLESGDGDERRDAAFALGAMGIRQDFEAIGEVEASVRALIAALEDPEAEVRAMAIWALDETNPSRKESTRYRFRGRDEGEPLK